MEEKDSFKFRVTQLMAGTYLDWSNDMEIISKQKGLLKFIKTPYVERDFTALPLTTVKLKPLRQMLSKPLYPMYNTTLIYKNAILR